MVFDIGAIPRIENALKEILLIIPLKKILLIIHLKMHSILHPRH